MRMYEENTTEMCDALASDLRKHKQEAIVLEVEFLKNDLRHTLMSLREWCKPDEVCYLKPLKNRNKIYSKQFDFSRKNHLLT